MQQQSNISLKYQLDKEAIIRFQILVYCYMNGMLSGDNAVYSTDIDCLTFVGLKGHAPLKEVCKELADYKILKTVGSVRNTLLRMEEMNMVKKDKKKGCPKMIQLHPDIKVQTTGNILLDIKCYSPE